MKKTLSAALHAAILSVLVVQLALGAGFFEQGTAPEGGYPSAPTFTRIGTGSITATDNASGNGTADLKNWRDAFINRNITGNGGTISGYFVGGLKLSDNTMLDDLLRTSALTAYVTQAALDNLISTVDVRSTGAKLDNTTDDLAAINAAIFLADGGTVVFPEGWAKISASITGGKSGTILRGVGREKTIINNVGSGHAITTPAGIRGYTIEHLQIVGQAGSADAIHVSGNFGHIQLRDLKLYPVQNGVDISEGDGIDILMDSVRVEGGTGSFNLNVTGPTVNSATAINCYANNSSTSGFDVYNVSTFTALESSSDNHTYFGWDLATAANLIGCTSEVNDLGGLRIAGSGFYNLHGFTTYGQIQPILINAAGADAIIINPRTSSTPSGASLDITTAANVTVIGTAGLDLGFSGNAAAFLKTGFGTSMYTSGTSISISGVKWLTGSGSPNTVITAPVGSVYSRIDGGDNTSLYIKADGVGNTGWKGLVNTP